MSTVTISDPVAVWVDGRLYRTWTISETTVGTGDEWSLPGLPTIFTITLFEAKLTTAGSATAIRPELGVVAQWTVDSLDHVGRNEGAVSFVRNGCDLRVHAPLGTLYGRSKPDASATLVTTRITVREGH